MHIALLDPLVARRIAAGEVIERPSSVVRELVDNAIDASPSSITIVLEEGGISHISVIDDGSGIAKEDLPLCCESHATSKIKTLDDLYHISSMGFRGEALYSISAVSRTTIASKAEGEDPATITVDNGKSGEVTSGGPDKGTKVTVENIFSAIPARREFLKRPSTEALMCKNVVLDKAIAYPDISFKMTNDGEVLLMLSKSDKKGRVIDVLSEDKKIVPSEMRELSASFPRFSLYAVASAPSLYRSDRSGIRIFVNNRPVDEFSLVQAVTYGYGEMLPGGAFPYCCLFVTIDPTLVDFNIHPTKREVRIRNKAEVHHAVTTMITEQMRRVIPRLVLSDTTVVQPNLNIQKQETEAKPNYQRDAEKPEGKSYSASRSPFYNKEAAKKPVDPQWFEKAREILSATHLTEDKSQEKVDSWDAQQDEEAPLNYIGQAFDLFLIAEKGDDLYLVDQHAAHERILFNEIRSKKGVQPLLVPLPFEVDPEVDQYLEGNLDIYLNLGIKLEKKENLLWNLLSIPALFKNIEGEIVSFIQHHTGDGAEVEKGLYAIVACHKAIKAGDKVDRTTAEMLLKEVFALEDPVCPHGRTFVIRLQKDELKQAVGRTL
jgi:DNA mismatch repair protein MutL